MEPAFVEGVFVEDRENISPRNSGWNREKSSREMSSSHHDLLQVQKLSISTIPIAQNREAILEEIATESPESRTHIRSTSSQIQKDLTTRVRSPKDESPLSQVLKQIDGGIVGGENSDDVSTPTVGINGNLSKEADSLAQNIRATTFLNQTNSEISNNEDLTPFTDHKSNRQKERHESAGESSSCARREAQHVTEVAPQLIEAKKMNKGNNTQQDENSIDQQGNNMKNTTTHSTASTNGNCNFSFAMTCNSSQLTPILNAGITQSRHIKYDKGRRNVIANEQGHEQIQEKAEHSDR